MQPSLTSPFRIGEVELANRVVPARRDRQLVRPPAGPPARRRAGGLGDGLQLRAHYRNERTLTELPRLHPDEHPVSIQLFGQDPEVMRSAAAIVAEAGADLIDINMGCPVRKVRKTAGAALLSDPILPCGSPTAAREGAVGP